MHGGSSLAHMQTGDNGLNYSFNLLVRMLLVAMPGAPSSVLAPSSKARRL